MSKLQIAIDNLKGSKTDDETRVLVESLGLEFNRGILKSLHHNENDELISAIQESTILSDVQKAQFLTDIQ